MDEKDLSILIELMYKAAKFQNYDLAQHLKESRNKLQDILDRKPTSCTNSQIQSEA